MIKGHLKEDKSRKEGTEDGFSERPHSLTSGGFARTPLGAGLKVYEGKQNYSAHLGQI